MADPPLQQKIHAFFIEEPAGENSDVFVRQMIFQFDRVYLVRVHVLPVELLQIGVDRNQNKFPLHTRRGKAISGLFVGRGDDIPKRSRGTALLAERGIKAPLVSKLSGKEPRPRKNH